MVRGTTPTLTFTLPFPVSTLSSLFINISQHFENIQIEKALADCSISGNDISVVLTQEDTLKLMPDKPAYIQIRALTAEDDYAIASTIVRCSVSDILKEGVIGDE